MTKILFGQLTPQLQKSDFPPWPVNQLHVALVKGQLTPRQIRTSCLWTMIDRTGSSESGLFMLLRNVLITLGLMTLWVWHEQDSGIAGGGAENFGDFLKRESSKVI